MKYKNMYVLVVLLLIIITMCIFFTNTEPFSFGETKVNSREGPDFSRCNKTHTYGTHINLNNECYKLLMNERDLNADVFSNPGGRGGGGDGGGDGGGGGGGGYGGGDTFDGGTGQGRPCFIIDDYGYQHQGTYNSEGKCIPTKIDNYQFCPLVEKLMHDTWKLKVTYPYRDDGNGPQPNVTKYWDIYDYVEDFIKIDNKYNVNCPVSYVP